LPESRERCARCESSALPRPSRIAASERAARGCAGWSPKPARAACENRLRFQRSRGTGGCSEGSRHTEAGILLRTISRHVVAPETIRPPLSHNAGQRVKRSSCWTVRDRADRLARGNREIEDSRAPYAMKFFLSRRPRAPRGRAPLLHLMRAANQARLDVINEQPITDRTVYYNRERRRGRIAKRRPAPGPPQTAAPRAVPSPAHGDARLALADLSQGGHRVVASDLADGGPRGKGFRACDITDQVDLCSAAIHSTSSIAALFRGRYS
jgi:hypothetical protein